MGGVTGRGPRAPVAGMALVMAAACLVGCEPSFDDRFQAVGPGDTRGDVVAALGAPDRADPFVYTRGTMGPPEVLERLVPDSTVLDALYWERPADGDTLAYWLYLTPDGEVVATYSNSIYAVY